MNNTVLFLNYISSKSDITVTKYMSGILFGSKEPLGHRSAITVLNTDPI